MGLVKTLSSTRRKIRQTTEAVGKTALDGVSTVKSTAANTVQSGVGLAANTVQSGVGLAANTVQSGVGLAANTVHSGVGLVANTAELGVGVVGSTVQGGVGFVGNTAQLGVGAARQGVGLASSTVMTGAALGAGTLLAGADLVGGGVHLVGGGVMHAISGNSTHSRRIIGNLNEMEIYCSDLYTVDFVLEEIAKAKRSNHVDTLQIEDLLLRDDPKLLKAAINLVYKTTMTPQDEFDLDDDEQMPQTIYERPWQNLTFCECISSAEEYRQYMEKKKEFQANLRKVLKKKGVNKMPIKFTAKVEIAMIDMNEMIDMLHEIENDKSILAVKFPDYCKGDIRKLPSALADHFDEETLDWKDDAEPVEIHIKYGSKPAKKSPKGKRPTLLVRQCSLKLEHIVMNSSKCFDDALDDEYLYASQSVCSMPML